MQRIIATQSIAFRISVLRGLATAALVLASVGCSHSVVVDLEVPTPVVEQAQVTVGVLYDGDFSNYVSKETIPRGPTWEVAVGDANVHLFEQILGAMFSEPVSVDAIPAENPEGKALEFVIHPVMDDYAFLTPAESGANFYAVSIRYRIQVLDAATAAERVSWTVNSYGKSPAKALNAEESMIAATRMAMRDAVAAIVVGLRAQLEAGELLSGDMSDDIDSPAEQPAQQEGS